MIYFSGRGVSGAEIEAFASRPALDVIVYGDEPDLISPY